MKVKELTVYAGIGLLRFLRILFAPIIGLFVHWGWIPASIEGKVTEASATIIAALIVWLIDEWRKWRERRARSRNGESTGAGPDRGSVGDAGMVGERGAEEARGSEG